MDLPPIPKPATLARLIRDASNVQQTQVFSGGACNILDAGGNLLRNAERDPINEWLSERGVYFFDPQIHPDTHQMEYDYNIHHKLEIAARKSAGVNLYEVSPRSFGAITSFEIAADRFRYKEPMIIYFSDGDPTADTIPHHNAKGHPLFEPLGIRDHEPAMRAHYREFIKNGNNARKYVMQFAREMQALTVTFDEEIHKGDMIITPTRLHASDLFAAIVKAASGERIFINFTGGSAARDEKGNPIMQAPINPPEVQMLALLDQYVDEGNQLRRAIAELMQVNVFVRIVYTQKSAILALEEVLKIKGIL